MFAGLAILCALHAPHTKVTMLQPAPACADARCDDWVAFRDWAQYAPPDLAPLLVLVPTIDLTSTVASERMRVLEGAQ